MFSSVNFVILDCSLGPLRSVCGEFPGGAVVRTHCFHCSDPGSVPDRGTKTMQ